MENKKSIYACLEEIKQREISDLKGKLMLCDEMKYEFEKNVSICINDGTPHDVRVVEAKIATDGHIEIFAYDEKVDQVVRVSVDDIIYGHIEFITDAMPIRTFSQESFSISRLSREDLEQLGFDTSDVDDKTMQRIADKLGEDYCEQLFWISLEIIAEEGFNIPKRDLSKDDDE